jgi:hypothetical protein
MIRMFRHDQEETLPAYRNQSFTSSNPTTFGRIAPAPQAYQMAMLGMVGATLARLRLGNSPPGGSDPTKCTQETLQRKYLAIEALNRRIPCTQYSVATSDYWLPSTIHHLEKASLQEHRHYEQQPRGLHKPPF